MSSRESSLQQSDLLILAGNCHLVLRGETASSGAPIDTAWPSILDPQMMQPLTYNGEGCQLSSLDVLHMMY